MGILTVPATESALSSEQIRKSLATLSDDLNWALFLMVCKAPGITLTQVLYPLGMDTKDGSPERQQIRRRLTQLANAGVVRTEKDDATWYFPDKGGVESLAAALKALL